MDRSRIRRLTAAAGAWLALGTCGCFKATFDDPSLPRGAEHDEWRSRFVLGLVGDGEVDARRFCEGRRVAEVRTGGNVATSLATVFTLFIYTPRKVYVTCAADGKQASR